MRAVGIAVLGPLRVDGDGTSLGPRDRVVLETLTVRPGEVVSAERLADALWADKVPVTWPKVVQGCVVRLRTVFGADAIETSPQGPRCHHDGDSTSVIRRAAIAEAIGCGSSTSA
jgi:DNA-binding SARP family transcriptional activator